MATATNLGYPRIGARRELKRAVEGYWAGKHDAAALEQTTKQLRAEDWLTQQRAGLRHIPSNDFSLYDQVLDACAMVGAVPSRFGSGGERVDLDTYFAMARGRKGEHPAAAMEMTKWFDTNYHYIVPEFERGQTFRLGSSKAVDEFREAQQLGVHTRPVLIGPVSFLLLGKAKGDDLNPLDLLEDLLPVYEDVLGQLAEAGADWVQLDEPMLVTDLTEAQRAAFGRAYKQLSDVDDRLKLLVATYFGDMRDNLPIAAELPVDALHVDLVRGHDQLDDVLQALPADKALSLGLINGRNVWKTDLAAAINLAERAGASVGSDRLMVGPSCSLLHSPVDLESETTLDDELKSWLAFARQKLDEIVTVARAVAEGRDAVAEALADNAAAMESRRRSPRTHNPVVRKRTDAVDESMIHRDNPYPKRRPLQQEALNLPPLPTTTIGSFPQTPEIRKARAAHRRDELSRQEYEKRMEAEIERAIRFQEEAGLDVLVHGEPERTDMVEHFGQFLEGFTTTASGWIQSYGSRCVKPPIIYGDVRRTEPMTVGWTKYAQSLTDKPVKGMLTGPVTILQWSLVRDDQPRSATCRQIALAIRDEVADLERAGIQAIQIDEPAFREGLPLRRADWESYLRWAVECFRLASCVVDDRTQIHTHMCYSEFNDIIEAIADLDADVISVETSRSDMELLDAFVAYRYPNEIGPGVWDIHSPLVPSTEQMRDLLRKALNVLEPQQVWANPDCGLKTRNWEEVAPALEHLVEAARHVRGELTAVPSN